LGWFRLDLCVGLGWVEFFFTHHGGLGQKIPSTRPMHTPIGEGVSVGVEVFDISNFVFFFGF